MLAAYAVLYQFCADVLLDGMVIIANSTGKFIAMECLSSL